MDLEEIEVIMNCPTQRSLIDVRCSMGPDDYYRKVIEGFSNISYPITYLQKKENKFEFSHKCQERF
jgi:hypothetical protein